MRDEQRTDVPSLISHRNSIQFSQIESIFSPSCRQFFFERYLLPRTPDGRKVFVELTKPSHSEDLKYSSFQSKNRDVYKFAYPFFSIKTIINLTVLCLHKTLHEQTSSGPCQLLRSRSEPITQKPTNRCTRGAQNHT